MMHTFSSYFQSNPYPGRGILFGVTRDGACAAAAYFIMGRSANSQNRIFVEAEGGIHILPYDETKVEDASLIFYRPILALGNLLIAANGVQSDTIYAELANGRTFEEALKAHAYEPDAPHYTPRISGVLALEDTFAHYRLSTLYKAPHGVECLRAFHHYTPAEKGVCHLIHTYAGEDAEGRLLPFREEPRAFQMEDCWNGDIHTFTNALWGSFNPDYRVSLFTTYLPLDGGPAKRAIINRHAH